MKRQRRIALVDLSMEFTGGQSYLHNLIALLDGEAQLWLIKLSSGLTADAASLLTHTIDLGFATGWGRALQIPLTMLVLGWLRLRHRIDAVWVNGYPEIALMPWARLLGCEAIATRHLTLLTDKPRWHWIRSGWRVHFLYERLAPTADRIVCVSGAVADSLSRYVRQEKLIVIPNWISTLPAPISPRPAAPRSLRLLFVGRLIHHKGVTVLIEAVRQLTALRQERGLSRSIALTVVGEGQERAELERAATGLPICFAGFHRETASFYRVADVFINPTLGPEGLPLVSLDAMSHGVACLFSDIPVHREITDNGKAALLFRNGDAADLAQKLLLLLQEPETLSSYGQRAREVVESRHVPEVARQRYFDLLNFSAGDPAGRGQRRSTPARAMAEPAAVYEQGCRAARRTEDPCGER